MSAQKKVMTAPEVLEEWEREKRTNEYGLAKYADRAIKLIEDWINGQKARDNSKMKSTPSNELYVQLKALKIPFETEYKFHPDRKWRFDYAIIQAKIAIEVHGGVYTQGRHTRGKGFENDREKINTATILGWRVLEVTPEQIRNGKAIEFLSKLMETV